MLPIIKYYVRRFLKKDYILITAIGKSFVKNRIKNKIFFCTTVSKFQEILTSNISDEAKQISPKK